MTSIKHLFIDSSLWLGLSTALAFLVMTSTLMTAAEIAGEKNLTRDAMDQQCQELLRQQQKLAEDQKAENTELRERVLVITRAPDDKKVALMSELLARLVEQNAVTTQRTDKFQKTMLAHLMKHVQLATPGVPQCPMLKDTTDMKDLKNMHDVKSPNNEIAK